MNYFVFCHGFGFNPHFWSRIAPYFSAENCCFINLGYFNESSYEPQITGDKIIGIGHSMGLSKLLGMSYSFDYLIGLNSFINFLGSDERVRKQRMAALKALRSSFLKAPDMTLQQFYTRCGAAALLETTDFSNLSVDSLLSDFTWLEKSYELPAVPTLILSAADDIIVPHNITVDNFSRYDNVTLETFSDGGHALGFTKPFAVYEKIMRFVNDMPT